MAPAQQDPRVEAWLAGRDRTVRPIAAAACGLLDEGLPKARQAIKWGYPTWVGAGNVAAVADHESHVNLQFYRGARLPDPQGLLEGTGKEMRHVKLRQAKDLRTPGVKALVRSAWRVDQGAAAGR